MEVQEGKPEGWYNCECFVCGKRLHRNPYDLSRAKHHVYCSQKCHYIDKKRYMSGKGNHQYGLKGEKNATFHGGRKLNRFGYWQVQCIGHPFARGRSDYMLEHRLIAEQYLLTDDNSVEINGKRYLKPEYHVHHKNFIRTDNRPENLQVMTKSEHQSLHEKIKSASRPMDQYGRFIKQHA